MTLRQIMATFRRRWLTIVVSVVVAVGAAAAYSFVQTPSYQSSALVQFALPAATGTGVNPLTLPSPIDELTANATQVRAAGILHDASPALSASQVTGSVDPNTGALTVTATAESPSRSQAVAQAYAQAVVDATAIYAQARVDKYTAAIAALTNQIAVLQAKPGAALDPLVAAQVTSVTGQIAALQTAQSNIQFGEPYASVQVPASPGAPTGLSKSKLGIIGLLAGLIAGCGLALARDELDDRVRDAPDIETMMEGPLLGELPQDREVRSGQVSIALVQAPQSYLAEAVRDLRTSLRVLLADTPSPLLMVTSPQAGDGKTFVTSNLAAAWALTGSRVIVVSADFRRPRLEDTLGVEASELPGLSDLIRSNWKHADAEPSEPPSDSPRTGRPGPTAVPGGDLRLSDLLVETGIEGLRLLPVGLQLDNPSELFGGPGMRPVLDQLRDAADIVLLDTPPVLATPDAAILGSQCDGAILVASKGKTDRGDLERTAHRLHAVECLLLGLVLNKVRGGSGDAYQAYAYRS